MQLVLALLVAAIQAAGPWFCCCASAHFAAQQPPAPSDSKPAGCSHCTTGQSSPAGCCRKQSAPDDSRRPADRLPDCCECCGLTTDATPPPTPVPAPTPADSAPAPLPGLPAAAFLLVASVPSASLAGVTNLPFLTAGAKLYAHHVLRC